MEQTLTISETNRKIFIDFGVQGSCDMVDIMVVVTLFSDRSSSITKMNFVISNG